MDEKLEIDSRYHLANWVEDLLKKNRIPMSAMRGEGEATTIHIDEFIRLMKEDFASIEKHMNYKLVHE